MAGRQNVIEYVFQGDTLDLQDAIKRVTKLMNESYKNFVKFQDGLITPSQKDQLKRLKRLTDELKTYVGREDKLVQKGNEDRKRQVDATAKQAINDAISLHKQSLHLDDKEFEQKREHQKIMTADQQAFYSSLAGQLKGESQADQLVRLSELVKPSIGGKQYEAIQNVVEQFRNAQNAFDKGIATQDDLANATRKLDEVYKQYATTLQRVKVNQKEANKGPEKTKGLLGQLFGKFKSISLYRLARLAVQAILSQLKAGLDAIAKKNSFFNDMMSQLMSSFKFIANQISSVLAPALSVISPIINKISKSISDLSNKLAAMFSIFAGDESVTIAKYRLEDYLDTLQKAAKGLKGIDELNVLDQKSGEEESFEVVSTESVLGEDIANNLKGVTGVIKELTALVGNTLNPVMEVLSVLLVFIGNTLGVLFTALKPVFDIIVGIVTFVTGAVGGVLSFLINNILIPIINWLGVITSRVELLIPIIASLLALLALFNSKALIAALMAIENAFIAVAASIWGAIKAVITWIAQQTIMIAKNIKSAISAWIASKQYWKLAIAIIASAGIAAVAVAAIVMAAASSSEATANSSIGSEPHLARGGIVKQPTIAMVGEGNYNEAVIPLGNSPQFEDMKQGIAERVISAGGSGSSNRPIILTINGKELARTIIPDLEYALPQTGMKLRRS